MSKKLVILSIVLIGVTARLSLANPLKLVSDKGIVGPSGTIVTQIIFNMKTEADSVNPQQGQIRSEIIYPGTVRPFNGRDVTMNQTATLAVVHFAPVTDVSQVYLVLANSNAITVMADFNEKLNKLCQSKHKNIDASYVFVNKIIADTLYVGSRSYEEADYRMVVRVSPEGNLTLLEYQKKPFRKRKPL